jgi:hypothetical protein
VVTSVEPDTGSASKDTETTSSQGILVEGDTQIKPIRKSPRLQERDDDEVVEVPPPPKVYTIVDLTEEGTDSASTLELNAPTQLQKPTWRRGRPCKARLQTQAADKKNSISKPSQDA